MKNARGLFLVPFFLFAAAAAFPAGGQSQGPPNQDFSMIKMCARIADYDNRFDLSDPLKSFVYYQYLQASGKQSLLRSVHSFRIKGFFPPPNAPDLPVRRESREAILNTEIRGMIRYQDSVAGIITTFQAPLFLITYYSKEDGHWLRAGEDLGNDLEDAYRVFKNKARNFAETIEIIGRQKNVSTNPAVLSAYLERLGKSPKEFMKDALGRHRLVIYGEIHRRKASWDFLRDLIADPVFVHRTGTIFLELSSDKQDVLDAFFLKDKLDPVSLWDIFQNVQINGWYDRGVYEFLIDAWRLNHRLPGPKKVRVVAVDVP
ncbi:MAG: hypothetical protein JW843_09970, partial [Candidatus Aminicenantes bacterium]|nr:hypothetical protein [Candidatus Aminicenantes bacterium]